MLVKVDQRLLVKHVSRYSNISFYFLLHWNMIKFEPAKIPLKDGCVFIEMMNII